MKKTIVITVEDGTVNLHTNDMGSIEELIVTLATIFERACHEGGYEPLSSLEKCMDEDAVEDDEDDEDDESFWYDDPDDYDDPEYCDVCEMPYTWCSCD